MFLAQQFRDMFLILSLFAFNTPITSCCCIYDKDFVVVLIYLAQSGCKESQFYSLPFGQAVAYPASRGYIFAV